ncbi:MAG: hypothetical protein WBG02_15070 [Candidatus Acidiferrum sp.]
MKYWLILLLTLIPGNLQAESSKPDAPSVLAKICGRVTEVKNRRTAWSYTIEVGPGHPKRADVLLYRREARKKCCAQEALVSKMSTDSDGGFDFKESLPGEYWIVVVTGKNEVQDAA